jgi:hypothetical protein
MRHKTHLINVPRLYVSVFLLVMYQLSYCVVFIFAQVKVQTHDVVLSRAFMFS